MMGRVEGIIVGERSLEVGFPRIIALAMAQVIIVAIVIAIGTASTGGAPPAAYLLAVLSGTIVLAAHRFPVSAVLASILIVIAYYVLELPPIGVAIPILGAAYLAAAAGRIVVTATSAVVLIALSAIFRSSEGGESSSLLAYDTVTNLALIAAVIAVAAMQRARGVATRQQTRLSELERRAADRRLDSERLRISRELHDSLGHRLAIVAVYAGVAAEAESDAERIAALHHVHDGTRRALDELRDTIRTIRHGFQPVSEANAVEAIQAVASALRHSGLRVDISIDTKLATLTPALQHFAIRIIQEAATNVLRHSRATNVKINVHLDDGLTVSVKDNGSVDNWSAGQGILGMRQRAEELRGTLQIHGDRNGFTVEARVPGSDTA